MIFEVAIKLLKDGEKIRRKDWADKDYLLLKNGKIVKVSNGTEIHKVDGLFCTNSSFLDDDWDLYQGPILDEEEKKYLSAVIKPFRDRVIYLRLCECGCNFVELNISVKSLQSPYFDVEMVLPCFKKGTMYKGMEVNSYYSAKELGL